MLTIAADTHAQRFVIPSIRYCGVFDIVTVRPFMKTDLENIIPAYSFYFE